MNSGQSGFSVVGLIPFARRFLAKGDLLVGSGDSGLATRVPAGADTQVLTLDSTQAGGMKWATPAAGGMTNPMTTQDDLIVGGSSGTATRLAKGSDSQVLTVDPTTHHVTWDTPAGGMTDPTTTEGDLIYRHSGAPARLAIPSTMQALQSNGTDPLWSTSPFAISAADRPPTSPSTYDDEFNSSSLNALWTTYNLSTHLTVTAKSYGVVEFDNAGGDSYTVRGMYLGTSPAGDFTVVCRVDMIAFGNFVVAGIGVWQGTGSTDGKLTFGLYSGGTNFYRVDLWTSDTASSQVGAAGTVGSPVRYLRFRRVTSGTASWFYDMSSDGLMWLNIGSHAEYWAISKIGLVLLSNNSAAAAADFGWFRQGWTPDFTE